MNLARKRYLLVFFAAMFLANNALAAARACIVEFGETAHEAMGQAVAGGHEGLCPGTEGAARCLTHFSQSYNNDEQKLWTDVPGVSYLPARSFIRVWFGPTEAVRYVVPARPIGPSLTILFGNLRI